MQRDDRRDNEPARRFPPRSSELLTRVANPRTREPRTANQCDMRYSITLMPTAYESMENCLK